ncbi:hypothetical protein ACFV30_40095 [Streptomyces sp. NPDC059752]|uniref:hypothetical protein n=1 Tax=unclassified Streptomyces TaxID=2593676 RepID=UPI003652B60E
MIESTGSSEPTSEFDGPHGAEKITRFGGYCTHELDLSPKAYEPHLDVGFTRLGPENEAR